MNPYNNNNKINKIQVKLLFINDILLLKDILNNDNIKLWITQR